MHILGNIGQFLGNFWVLFFPDPKAVQALATSSTSAAASQATAVATSAELGDSDPVLDARCMLFKLRNMI